jgi:hypothetical protein
MTQGCPAFTPDTIHIKLSSNVQTAGKAGRLTYVDVGHRKAA